MSNHSRTLFYALLALATPLLSTPLRAGKPSPHTASSPVDSAPVASSTIPLANALKPEPPASDIWQAGVGNGLKKGTWDTELVLGGALGSKMFGSHESHDLLYSGLQFGRVVGDPIGVGRWYQGNLELLGLLASGAQIDPHSAYFVSINPVIRYDFATGTPLVPFVQGSAGFMATDIKEPDLSSVFQFNEQIGAGFQYFLTQNFALSAEYRYMHISNAGLEKPNSGVNLNLFLAGVSYLF